MYQSGFSEGIGALYVLLDKGLITGIRTYTTVGGAEDIKTQKVSWRNGH